MEALDPVRSIKPYINFSNTITYGVKDEMCMATGPGF